MTRAGLFLTGMAALFALAPSRASADGEGFMTANPEFPEITISYKLLKTPAAPGGAFSGSIHVTIPEGWHIYAPGADKKYRRLEVEPGEGSVEDLKFTYPPGHVMDIIGEMVPVYDGEVKIGFEGRLADGAAAAGAVWRPVVRWQSCSDRLCLTPESRTLDIPLKPSGG